MLAIFFFQQWLKWWWTLLALVLINQHHILCLWCGISPALIIPLSFQCMYKFFIKYVYVSSLNIKRIKYALHVKEQLQAWSWATIDLRSLKHTRQRDTWMNEQQHLIKDNLLRSQRSQSDKGQHLNLKKSMRLFRSR